MKARVRGPEFQDYIRNRNPMFKKGIREKVSKTLKRIGHKPAVRGGNGTGKTNPEKVLLAVLGKEWRYNFAVSLGKHTPGFPTNYKIDIANEKIKLGVEVDGFSHSAVSRQEQDRKKEKKLTSLGWQILRFSNKEVMENKERCLSLILKWADTLALR